MNSKILLGLALLHEDTITSEQWKILLAASPRTGGWFFKKPYWNQEA